MNDTAGLERAAELLELIEGKWTTQVIGAAAQLAIADHIAAGSDRIETLAAATASDRPSLERLMCALQSLGLCSRDEEGAYRLTPAGRLLRDGERGSLRGWAIWSSRYHWATWGRLLESIQSGRSARAHAGGTVGYGHLERDAAATAAFNRGIADVTRIVAAELCRAYDFSWARTVVDVGGGAGELLRAVIERNRHLRGILFDLPHALEGGGELDRCERIGGDFFTAVPACADAYLLKSILHNWDDERCGTILARCREAMGPGARLLLVERVMPERMSGSPGERALVRSDLNMLVGFSGRERTCADFRVLLGACGLEIQASAILALGFSLLDCRPSA